MDYNLLPHLNALLNSSSAICLIVGYFFIRSKRVFAHRVAMTTALVASSVFLTSYLIYHYHHGTTRFAGEGVARAVYLTILISHTILAVVIVPLIAVTLWRAWHGEFVRHRRIARWTFPLWLYVSVTGVIVYFMLYRIYPSA